MFNKFLLIVFFILFYIFEPVEYGSIDKETIIISALFYVIGMFLHFKLNHTKNWFRLDILFLLSFFIAFLILPLSMVLADFFPKFPFYGIRYRYYINYGTWIVTSVTYAWLIGFNFFLNNKISKKRNKIFEFKYPYKILLYISLILFIALVISIKDFILSGVYNGVEDWSMFSRYLYALFSTTIIVTTVFIFIHYRTYLKQHFYNIYKIDKIYIALISLYSIIFLLIIGDRGSFLQLASAILFIYAIVINPISLKKLFILIMFGSLLLTIVGLGRNPSEDILSKGYSRLGDAYKSKSVPAIYLATQDLAGTARIFYKSLETVPKKHDYFYGKTMLPDVFAPIPFLNSIIDKLFDGNKKYYYEKATSVYITYLIEGHFPHWGEGSNLLADIYINFGYFGCVLIMFILGVLFKKISNEIVLLNNIKYLLIATALSTYVIYWSRAGLFEPLKPIIWYLIIYFIFIKKNILQKLNIMHPKKRTENKQKRTENKITYILKCHNWK